MPPQLLQRLNSCFFPSGFKSGKIVSFLAQHFSLAVVSVFLIVALPITKSYAIQPEHARLPIDKPFVLNLGLGYGIANQPLVTVGNNEVAGGLVVSGSLGYRFSNKFSLEFGPSFWIEGRDVLNNSAANNERPSNKRMLISFNGLYKPFGRIPIQVKLGAGVGSIIYSPQKSVVIADGKGTTNTEFASGVAGCIGFIGEVKLSQKIKIHPSLNFTYSNINKQKIEYNSNINHQKPSVNADFRLNFMFEF